MTALVVLPPAIIAGYQFPMLIALFGQGRERLGRDVGLAYAANTAGAIVGSLAGGFGVLPWLSAPGAWRLVAIVLGALGVAAAVLGLEPSSARSAVDVALTVAAGTVGRCAGRRDAPAARRCRADGGLAPRRHRRRPRAARRPHVGEPAARLEQRRALRAIVWERDGVESSVALARRAERLRVHRQRQVGRQRARRRRHAGDARPARRARPSAADARARHRPRHRQQRRVARRDSVDGTRRRRRARAGRARRRPRVRSRSTTA